MTNPLMILFISVLLIQCGSSRINKNCKEISITLNHTVVSYYKNNDTDAQSIAPIMMRWETLFNHLCSKIAVSHVFCIVEVSGKYSGKQEGLFYNRNSKNFYYFNRSGIKILLKLRENELNDIYSLIRNIMERPKEKFMEIMQKSTNVTVSDAPNVDILYINLDDKEKSYFFSMQYSDYIFRPG